MRRLLLIVMLLVMVPLRTWAGDALAPPTATASGARGAMGVSAHCHGAPAAAIPATHDHRHHAPGTTCGTCQACTSIALLAPVALVPGPALPNPLPQTGNARYTSVTVALRHKPPIF